MEEKPQEQIMAELSDMLNKSDEDLEIALEIKEPEIEIEDETPQESDLEEAEKGEKEKNEPTQQEHKESPSAPPKKRIYHGKYERERIAREQAEQIAYQKAYEAEMYRQQLEEERRLRQVESEHTLDIKESYAKDILKEAVEAGDTAKIAEANQLLAKFAAEKTLKKNMPQETYQDNYNQYSPQYYQPQYQQPSPQNPNFLEWLDRNDWYDPDSYNYNPSLVQEVDGMANELTKLYQLEGMGDQIGDATFFNIIDDTMKKKYGLEKSSNNSNENVSSGRPQTYAPVTNMSNTSSLKVPSSAQNKVKLSKAEAEMAIKMNYHHPDGRIYTPQEAYKRYAQSKL